MKHRRCGWSILFLIPIGAAFFYGVFGFANYFAQGEALPYSFECLIGSLAICGGFLVGLFDEMVALAVIGGLFIAVSAALAFDPFWSNSKWTRIADLAIWAMLWFTGFNLVLKSKNKPSEADESDRRV